MNISRKSTFKWFAGIIGCTAILAGLFVGITQWKIVPVSTEGMTCLEAKRYPDGRILFLLGNPDSVFASGWDYRILENGSCYMIPKRAALEPASSWNENVLNQWQIFDMHEMQSKAGGISINAYYVGSPNQSPVLVYKAGMEVPYVGYESPRKFGIVRGPYDELLDSFCRHWVFDRSRGSEILIERYAGSGWDAHPESFPDGIPEWIISLTGGAFLTDKDVVGMTSNSVLFYQKGFYFELRHIESGGIEYAWGNSPDNLNEVIRCEETDYLNLV